MEKVFVCDSFRPGQKELALRVYEACLSGETLVTEVMSGFGGSLGLDHLRPAPIIPSLQGRRIPDKALLVRRDFPCEVGQDSRLLDPDQIAGLAAESVPGRRTPRQEAGEEGLVFLLGDRFSSEAVRNMMSS